MANEAVENTVVSSCINGQHQWKKNGHRKCPMGREGCLQNIYRCACGAHDFGNKGQPGYIECEKVCGDELVNWPFVKTPMIDKHLTKRKEK